MWKTNALWKNLLDVERITSLLDPIVPIVALKNRRHERENLAIASFESNHQPIRLRRLAEQDFAGFLTASGLAQAGQQGISATTGVDEMTTCSKPSAEESVKWRNHFTHKKIKSK